MARQNQKRNPFSISNRGAILLIILATLCLHVWGLDFGLPQALHPDEPIVVTTAQDMVITGDLNPRAFHWPSLQTYILALEYKLWFWVGNASGAFDFPDLAGFDARDRFAAHTLRNPSAYYLTGRFTTVIFSAALIWIFYLLALRFFKPTYAIPAAILLALNPIVHASGRYITPDIPAEFFFVAAVYFLDRLHSSLLVRIPGTEKLTPIQLASLSALMIGLGTGTKYPVVVLAAPLLAIILFTPSNHNVGWRVLLALQAAIALSVVFLITTPFAILDFPIFLHDIQTIGRHMREGHIGMELHGSIWVTSLRGFLLSCGWLWLTTAIIGLFAFFGNLKRTWPLLFAFAVTLTGLEPLTVYADRYLIPVIPFMIFGIVSLFAYIDGLYPQLNEAKKRSVVIFAVAGILVAAITGTFNLVSESYNLTQPNTRLIALDWIEENIPTGSIIVEEQGAPNLNEAELLPLVPVPYYYVTEITPLFSREGENKDPLDVLYETRPDWVITSSNVRGRYEREGAEEQFPDLVAAFEVYYELIDGYLTEVKRIKPGNGVTGDEIVVYRVPEGLWDRVVLETSTVDEVLGER